MMSSTRVLTLLLIAWTVTCGVTRAQLAGEGGPQLQASWDADALVWSEPSIDDAISPFVRRIFQDRRGHLWFGTNGDGVARYDGGSLEYFSVDDGVGGVAVRAILEDDAGDLWFGTSGGVTRYDGHVFENFDEDDGLADDDVWSMTFDREETLWVGTLQGVSRFDGVRFAPFDLPETEPDPARGVTSSRIVHSIVEDSKDRMWFATNGGVFVLDGESLSNLSSEDGLCDDAVNDILEADDGTFWFATHHGGVCCFDGTSFEHVTAADGVRGTEVWSLYQDRAGNVWFPVEGDGVYCFDGRSFRNVSHRDGLASRAIQCMFEDANGRMWAGGHMGAFRSEGDAFVTVTRDGPWQ